MLASMAASAVLLFATPHSPMAQPWNLVVGHAVSALAGWLIGMLIVDPVVAAAVAVGLAILLMHLSDSLHPPGAATALTLVLGGAQYHHMGGAWVVAIIAANVGFTLLLALLINNLLPGRRYPVPHPPVIPQVKAMRPVEITSEDVLAALVAMDSVIDVSEDDLLEIYRRASQQARQRGAAQ
jgi:CBS domain-containing membrane protein